MNLQVGNENEAPCAGLFYDPATRRGEMPAAVMADSILCWNWSAKSNYWKNDPNGV